jgi:hypothetical protein
MGKLKNALKHAWSAFNEEDDAPRDPFMGLGSYGGYGTLNPSRNQMRVVNDKSIIASIYTRIGIDAAAIKMQHVRLDQNGRFVETIPSRLNECLTLEANMDQAARAFRQDLVMSLFDKGVIAIVPVETSLRPINSNAYDVHSLRVGEVVHWLPDQVVVKVYNEKTGNKEDVKLPKKMVSIVENPLYSVMNEPNGTLQRLTRKLALIDGIDEQAGSGKLDLIIQLPYVIKSEARRQQAEQRRGDIEAQLKGSKYGIAYTDGTERITQLNRPAENNMLAQITMLTEQLYSQLGLTAEIFNGTADEKAMLNYHNRTIEPVLTAITEGMKRTFLSKTARSQGQSIELFRDPFKLVALADMAEIADKFTRNEILSSNEIRAAMGMAPSKDAKADQLHNSNMPVEKSPNPAPSTPKPPPEAT